MEQWLKTADAARTAGVGTSTIKRWADEGRLACRKTAGGHRRYRRRDLDEIMTLENDEMADDWAAEFVRASAAELEAELLLAHARAGSWHAVALQLASGLAVLGQRWQAGELSIADEHRATERLHRTLANLCERILTPGRALAVVVNAPEDSHTLGLSLVELCLREAGFDVIWLGARTPVEAVVQLLSEEQVDLLAVSASSVSRDEGLLGDFATQLSAACAKHETELVLGGAGRWPTVPGAKRFVSWAQFSEFAFEIARTAGR